jgi:hypothetical protein
MSDDTLLAALADALRPGSDLVEDIAAQGRGVYTWLTIDDELALAELSHDSRLAATSALRGPSEDAEVTGPRVLVFQAEPLSVELEVGPEQIIGQIMPPCAGQIMIETPAGQVHEAAVDNHGFFVLPTPTEGPIRVRCETETGRLRTDWITM